MAIPMKQFIDRFKAMEKVANETLAAEPEALVGVDSLPGSEHDAKVPAEAKKPDEEVTQGQPAGATTAEGAVNGGDAKPLNEGKLEMDQPLLNPEQKPLVTDDALSAKTASDKLTAIVGDLLADLKSAKAPEKQASDKAPENQAPEKQASAKAPEKAEQPKEKKAERQKIELDNEMLSKLAAAQASYMLGREAAANALKQAAAKNPQANIEAARKLIKDACVKAAQESGLDPAAAEAAAANAMDVAGMGAPAEAAAADAAAADAGAAAADAGAAEAAAADAGAGIPEDVTEEELATAIVDLVSSGELDPNTAKALVEEIAGDDAAAGPTEDQAAEIIAQGLENGEITPEQAQEIAAAVEGGADAEAAGADAAAAQDASDEAQGAADAAAAIQDAKDEAQGAADAEEAMKSAAAQIRANAISKVASAVVAKRQEKQASAKPQPGSKIMSKVASILKAKTEKAKAEKAASAPDKDAKYIEGFKKKAEEMGVDPSALAKYVLDRQAK